MKSQNSNTTKDGVNSWIALKLATLLSLMPNNNNTRSASKGLYGTNKSDLAFKCQQRP